MTEVRTSGAPRGVPAAKDALVLVALGGTLGTAGRWALTAATGGTAGLATGTVVANVLGAFALGVLLARLDRPSFSPGRRARLRLFVGAGVLGGFTTYSTFAVHVADLAVAGALERVLWQSVVMVAAGVLAAWAGHGLGSQTLATSPRLRVGEA